MGTSSNPKLRSLAGQPQKHNNHHRRRQQEEEEEEESEEEHTDQIPPFEFPTFPSKFAPFAKLSEDPTIR